MTRPQRPVRSAVSPTTLSAFGISAENRQEGHKSQEAQMHSAGTQLSGLRNATVTFWHNLEEFGAMDIEEKMGMTSGSDSEDENEENNPLKAICLHSKFCQLSSSGSP